MKKISIVKASLFIFLTGLFMSTSILVGCSNDSDLDDKFVNIDIQYLAELTASSKEAFVYIGSPTCPACEEFYPIVLRFLNDENRELYYFDTDSAFLENPDKLIDLMESLNVTGTPTIIYLNGGEVQSQFEGSLTLESIRLFFESWE